jgi:hypothetical protein
VNFAVDILFRLVEIGDDAVPFVGRVDGDVDLSDELLVSTVRAERASAGEVASRRDLDPGDFGACERRQDERDDGDHQTATRTHVPSRSMTKDAP